MDFDIGTFIYILLTLVFIIIGSLGKKKRPQVNMPETDTEEEPEATRSNDVFAQNFKKLFGGFEDELEASEPVPEPLAEELENKLDSSYEKIDNLQGIRDVPGEKGERAEIYKMEDHIKEIMDGSNIMITQHSKSKSTFVSRALRDFDPKKAWLYSEIFKPKYF